MKALTTILLSALITLQCSDVFNPGMFWYSDMFDKWTYLDDLLNEPEEHWFNQNPVKYEPEN